MKCSCGISAAMLFRDFDKTEEELRKEKPDMLTVKDRIDDVIIHSISSFEKDCDLKISDEKMDELKEALKDIYNDKFDDAHAKIKRVDWHIWNVLLTCAEKEEAI